MKAPPKPEHERKRQALDEAIALFEANAEGMKSGHWYVAERYAQEIFEEMQRGEMGAFEDLIIRRWRAGDELAIAILCYLAQLHIFADKSMPDHLQVFVAVRLIEPTARPNVVDGKFAGWVPAKAKHGPKRLHNFSRENTIINIVRRIKQKYGYDAVRGADKRTPDGVPSAASIVAEASKIVGIGAIGSSGKRSQKRGVDESTVSNLWNKRDKRF